jgi:anaerobic dimethyl sulfoxide reductase subunit C
MNVHETPLVIFTVLAQMSVGCFVVLGIVHLAGARRAGAAAMDRLSDPALYAIGPVMLAGLVASIFHLGNPANALHVISHIDSSWLSREVFLGCAFTGLGAAFAVAQRLKWFTPLWRQFLAGATALVGLGLVWAMSMVYLLPTVPGWDSWATPVGFFTTTFLLGGLAVGAAFAVVFAVQAKRPGGIDDEFLGLLRASLRGIAVASIALLGVEFVVLPTYVLNLATSGGAEATAADSLLVAGGSLFVVRLILVFLGAGMLSLFLYRFANSHRDRLMMYAVSGAFALVLLSEVLGRILFYGSYARIGM